MTVTIGKGIRAGNYGGWNFAEEENFKLSNLGTNIYQLTRVVDKCGENNVFVDLGVDYGVSSLTMTYDAIERNNIVYGVDIGFNRLGFDLHEYENYRQIKGDSSSVGKAWDTKEYGTVKLLFIDSIHVAAQVATELYHWWDHMEEDSYIVFHDTNWPAGKHDLMWVPEVKQKGILWDRPEVAVGRFFGITELFEKHGTVGFSYEDEFISVLHRPESFGLTTVHIKKKKNFKENIDDWDQVFQDRNTVLGYFQADSDAYVQQDITEDL
jgi:hypothetical protein|tara:strand:+ start:2795 stop:3595 length:801 start_codon:yes stop_codon:yes gene_type:complete